MIRRLMIVVTLSACLLPSAGSAETITVEIVTAIRDKPGAFQVGEKTRHVLTLDTEKGTVEGEVRTGTTKIAGVDFQAIRKSFSQQVIEAKPDRMMVQATGQAASAVGFMPDIDYSLKIAVDLASKTATLTGSHDGYPSYTVTVNGKIVYDFDQGLAVELLGTSDVQVSGSNFSF